MYEVQGMFLRSTSLVIVCACMIDVIWRIHYNGSAARAYFARPRVTHPLSAVLGALVRCRGLRRGSRDRSALSTPPPRPARTFDIADIRSLVIFAHGEAALFV